MRFSRSWGGAAIGLGALLSVQASAFVAPAESVRNVSGKRVLRPATMPAAGKGEFAGARLEIDASSGATRIVQGRLAALDGRESTDAKALTGACLDYVAGKRGLAGGSVELRLDQAGTLIDPVDQLLKFNVYRDGTLVEDASLDCRFKSGYLVQIVDLTFAEAEVAAAARQAPDLQAAGSLIPGAVATYAGERWRVTADGSGGAYRLRPVHTYLIEAGGVVYNAQTDAATGAVFELVDSRHFATDGHATAEVYPRWWGETLQTADVPEARVKLGTATVTTDLAGRFSGADGATSAAMAGFKGARADVQVKTGSLVQVPGSLQDGSWVVAFRKGAEQPHVDKNMAQAMAYHHVNKIVAHASRYIAPNWFKTPLVTNVNLSQTCNAFWNGSSVNFYSAGGNCANTALSADVVYHEWGHGLDANTGGISDGAFSEGYGDIMSMIFSDSPELGKGFRTNGDGIRDLDNDNKYPDDQGEVHFEGLIIGGAFYHLYQALQADHPADVAFDLISKYAFKVIYAARRYTEVYNALLVIDDNDGDLGNDTPNFCAINRAFTRHGLARADADCGTAP